MILRHRYPWAGGEGRSVSIAAATGGDLALSMDLTEGSGDRVAALLMLCVTDDRDSPVSSEAVESLVLGDRNLIVAELVRMTFGNTADLQQRCSNPECRVELEWPLSMSDLSAGSEVALAPNDVVTVGDTRVTLRPATVGDERRIRAAVDPVQTLIDLCADPSEAVSTDDADVTKRIEATLEELDPLASIEFTFGCHICGQPMRTRLDLPALFLDMLRRDDMRRSDDHHVLASAYGWSPTELLDLRPADRTRFADKVIDLWED